VSKLQTPNEEMFEKCGTPAYIAPEILLSKQDKGYKGFKADTWSAGVVLYAMLFGAVPFKGANMSELHDNITTAKYSCKEEISADAKDLLSQMLTVDPEERITIQ
jgi:serine/threonine protein kinase